MKTPLLCSILFSTTSVLGHTENIKLNLPPGNYARQIDTRPLSDPSGTTHTRKEVKGKVVVAIFSAPNMSQGGRQEKWSDLLATQPGTKISPKVALFLVEDMSQAGMFKGIALDDMKKQFTPNSRPFLILDQDGSILRKFDVPRNQTAILIYDKRSQLRDVETDLDDQDATIHRVQVITAKLLEE